MAKSQGKLEQQRLQIEMCRLELQGEDKPMGAGFDTDSTKLSVAHNLRLLPPFNESEVEIFFFSCLSELQQRINGVMLNALCCFSAF